MRILVLKFGFNHLQGPSISLYEYLKHIAVRNSVFLYFPSTQADAFLLRSNNINPVVSEGNIGIWNHLNNVKYLLEKYDFDVIDLHIMPLPVLFYMLTRHWFEKVILTEHGVTEPIVDLKYHGLRVFAKHLARETELPLVSTHLSSMVAISNYMKMRLIQRYHPKRVVYIPNPIDTNFYKPCENAEKKRERSPVLLYVGILERNKRPDLLIKMMPYLLEEWSNTRLNIVGTGSMKDYLFNSARKLGVLSHIHFMDQIARDKMPHLYNMSDLLVQPSACESFSLPVIEAMACGKPVVAYDAYALSEHIHNSGAGQGFTNGNAEEIAQATGKILDNYTYYSRNARKYALNFDSKKIASIREQLYVTTKNQKVKG